MIEWPIVTGSPALTASTTTRTPDRHEAIPAQFSEENPINLLSLRKEQFDRLLLYLFFCYLRTWRLSASWFAAIFSFTRREDSERHTSAISWGTSRRWGEKEAEKRGKKGESQRERGRRRVETHIMGKTFRVTWRSVGNGLWGAPKASFTWERRAGRISCSRWMHKEDLVRRTF